MIAEKLLRIGKLFSSLPATAISSLAEGSEVRSVASGELLVRAGAVHESVVYLTQGRVSLYRKNVASDITLLLGILEAPSLFGDAECAAGVQWMCSVRAEEDCWCVLIPSARFRAVVDAHLDLAAHLYRDASVRHLLANHTAQTIALYDVRTRLIRLLLDYARHFGRRRDRAVIIERTISRVTMAASLGVTTKTILRTMQPLEDEGTISHSAEGYLVIEDVETLAAQLPSDLLGLSSKFGEVVVPIVSAWAPGDDD